MAGSTVGLIGVGNMGAPMAENLAKAGIAVAAFDTRRDVLEAAASRHAAITACATAAEAASAGEAVITMLPDSKVVCEVVLGPGGVEADPVTGIAAAMRPGAVLIDMSSSFAPTTKALAARLEASGLHLVDAPVSGGVAKAITGELAIITGGSEADVARVKPVLEAMGRVFHVGDVGSGHAMKAINNYLSAASLIATSEALVIGRAFGLDGDRMVDVLNASTGRSNTTEVKARQHMLSGKYAAGFTLGLLAKDVGMARQLADGLGVESRDLALVADMLQDALAELGPETDHTRVHQLIAKRSA